jgi:starch-binding outer membrane protein, SusD/RagB family
MNRKNKHCSSIQIALRGVSTSIMILCLFSCKKYAEIEPPPTGVVETNVYETNQTAISVLTGLYAKMSYPGHFSGSASLSLLTGLSADELTLFKDMTIPRYVAHFRNALGEENPTLGSEFWTPIYNYIFITNSAIEGLTNTVSLTGDVKQQLLGEAYFMRAFFYFYLVNLFGDVPLVISTDYKPNSLLGRSSKSEVYLKIIEDLTVAKNLLSGDYLNGLLKNYSSSAAAERLRPTKWAASALLSRVYLYNGDYANAEIESSIVISQSSLFTLSSLNMVFLKNSKETIWQLQPVNTGSNTEESKTFILSAATPPTTTAIRPVHISSQLINSFESGDQRKNTWTGSYSTTSNPIVTYYFPYKYKNNTASVTEYLVVLRLAELFLIRAEARAQQNNLSGAKDDLNLIRARAQLLPTTANDKVSIVDAIMHERQVELFTEWGYRWLDLKRTDKINSVMSVLTPIKASGAIWNSHQQLYPLPWSDIESDINLEQNPGYHQ